MIHTGDKGMVRNSNGVRRVQVLNVIRQQYSLRYRISGKREGEFQKVYITLAEQRGKPEGTMKS